MFKPISRRTVLRGAGGAGVAMALPWLEMMTGSVEAGEKLSKPPLRAAFLFKPNGVHPTSWSPTGKGEKYDANTPYLKPIAHLKDDFILLENLWNKSRNAEIEKCVMGVSSWCTVRVLRCEHYILIIKTKI